MNANIIDHQTVDLLERAQHAVERIDRSLSCSAAQSGACAMCEPVESDFVASVEEAKAQLQRGW